MANLTKRPEPTWPDEIEAEGSWAQKPGTGEWAPIEAVTLEESGAAVIHFRPHGSRRFPAGMTVPIRREIPSGRG